MVPIGRRSPGGPGQIVPIGNAVAYPNPDDPVNSSRLGVRSSDLGPRPATAATAAQSIRSAHQMVAQARGYAVRCSPTPWAPVRWSHRRSQLRRRNFHHVPKIPPKCVKLLYAEHASARRPIQKSVLFGVQKRDDRDTCRTRRFDVCGRVWEGPSGLKNLKVSKCPGMSPGKAGFGRSLTVGDARIPGHLTRRLGYPSALAIVPR